MAVGKVTQNRMKQNNPRPKLQKTRTLFSTIPTYGKSVFLPSPTAGGGGVDTGMTLWLGLRGTHVETPWEGPRFVPIFVWGPWVCGTLFPFSPQSGTDPGWPGAPATCLGRCS